MHIPVDVEQAVRRECKRRRYSDKTAKTYCYCISRFLAFAGKTLGKISKKDVREFLEDLSEKGRLSIRHSFATHLVEEGYSLHDVQSMLGHKSPETSMIYVHTASPRMISIKSPFDAL